MLLTAYFPWGIRGVPLTSEFCFQWQMDNQIQCLVRCVFNPRSHTYILRTWNRNTDSLTSNRFSYPHSLLHFLHSLPHLRPEYQFHRRQNPHLKVDKVCIKENNFDFLRRFRTVGIDGNGLFKVTRERYFILFQWKFPLLSSSLPGCINQKNHQTINRHHPFHDSVPALQFLDKTLKNR